MTMLNLISAVARPYNLPPSFFSIESTVGGSGLDINWILVFDKDRTYPAWVWSFLEDVKKKISVDIVQYGGPYARWAIGQRNAGLERVKEGFFIPHDDDNILHPKFLSRLGALIRENPGKKGFIYGQQRWDGVGTCVMGNGATQLWSDPNNVKIGRVDSAMVTIHRDLVGADRYDLSKGGVNDGDFIERIYRKAPAEFVFVKEVLAYYNFLRVDNKGMSSQAYRG
jgi:hypothetical protein